jgi:hypothetical protein
MDAGDPKPQAHSACLFSSENSISNGIKSGRELIANFRPIPPMLHVITPSSRVLTLRILRGGREALLGRRGSVHPFPTPECQIIFSRPNAGWPEHRPFAAGKHYSRNPHLILGRFPRQLAGMSLSGSGHRGLKWHGAIPWASRSGRHPSSPAGGRTRFVFRRA